MNANTNTNMNPNTNEQQENVNNEELQRQLRHQEQKNKYDSLLASYVREIPGRMFIFEVTKCCYYSTFVLMYKDESTIELYNRVSQHFGTAVVALYIMGDDNKRIPVPMNSFMSVKEFVYNHIGANQRNLKPIYDMPLPVVYRIFYDDGFHCSTHEPQSQLQM